MAAQSEVSIKCWVMFSGYICFNKKLGRAAGAVQMRQSLFPFSLSSTLPSVLTLSLSFFVRSVLLLTLIKASGSPEATEIHMLPERLKFKSGSESSVPVRISISHLKHF